MEPEDARWSFRTAGVESGQEGSARKCSTSLLCEGSFLSERMVQVRVQRPQKPAQDLPLTLLFFSHPPQSSHHIPEIAPKSINLL